MNTRNKVIGIGVEVRKRQEQTVAGGASVPVAYEERRKLDGALPTTKTTTLVWRKVTIPARQFNYSDMRRHSRTLVTIRVRMETITDTHFGQ